MDRGRPELATYTSHLLPGWLRRFAGENFDELLCNIEIIGIQPVQMLLELLRSHGRAHILAAPEQKLGRNIERVCKPKQIADNWLVRKSVVTGRSVSERVKLNGTSDIK